MESRAKALGHAIHPMLIVFPLGLLSTAVIFDIVYLVTDRTGFAVAAAYMIAAGVVGGLVAAVFGLIDWLAVPSGTRAKRVGALHGLTNVAVVVLFAISWLLRAGGTGWKPGAAALDVQLRRVRARQRGRMAGRRTGRAARHRGRRRFRRRRAEFATDRQPARDGRRGPLTVRLRHQAGHAARRRRLSVCGTAGRAASADPRAIGACVAACA